MRAFVNAVIVPVVLAVVLSLLAGCAAAGGYQSASGQMGTRELSVTAAGTREMSLEVNPTTNSGIVVVGNHKIIVEGDSVLLDGRQVMTLSPESKRVDVTCAGGRLTISDGVGSACEHRL